ncbi:MAG: prolipoprotein diacylglyceryl transferase [Clostridiales bacterium]
MPDTSIAFYLGSFPVRWYGILISSGMALGILLAAWQAKKRGLDPDDLYSLCIWILPAAVIGARLYFVMMSWDYYSLHPGDILKIWKGGLAFHGGLIAAVAVALIYVKKRKINFFTWADILIPSVALGQSIGRWGNYFNQEAFGVPTDLPWGIFVAGAYRHPTFLYESLWDLAVFFVLTWLLTRPRKEGSVFAWYCILYSLGRFFVESLRTDSLMLGSWRVAQLVSVAFILIGMGILYYLRKKPLYIPYKKATIEHNHNKKKKKR